MTTQAVAVQNGAAIMEQVITKGDLKNLTAAERVEYYRRTCDSLGLNPLTKPFEYLSLRQNGPMVLYATRGATDQLRNINRVDIRITGREQIGDVYVVTAEARTPDGRTDSDIGVVTIKGLGGDALANALMKATTKAKRRVTLSIVGLSWLDESEIETVPTARVVAVDTATGEMRDGEGASQTIAASPTIGASQNEGVRTQGTDASSRDDGIPPSSAASERTPGGASVRSLNYALVLAQEAGIGDDDVHRWTGDQFGRVSRKDLDQRQMSALIEWLQAEKAARPDPAPAAAADEEPAAIVSWTQFWTGCRTFGVTSPAEYEAKVGAKQTAYPSPAAALAALTGAERG